MMYIRTYVCVHHDQECCACAHLGRLHRRCIDLAQGPLRMRIPSRRKEEVLSCNAVHDVLASYPGRAGGRGKAAWYTHASKVPKIWVLIIFSKLSVKQTINDYVNIVSCPFAPCRGRGNALQWCNRILGKHTCSVHGTSVNLRMILRYSYELQSRMRKQCTPGRFSPPPRGLGTRLMMYSTAGYISSAHAGYSPVVSQRCLFIIVGACCLCSLVNVHVLLSALLLDRQCGRG